MSKYVTPESSSEDLWAEIERLRGEVDKANQLWDGAVKEARRFARMYKACFELCKCND